MSAIDPKQAAGAATGAVEEPGAPTHAPPTPDLEDSSLYFNRELSWLDFNDRVLQLGEDTSVALLERVKFCAIWESNLDEFFMVRVANLHDQLEAGVDARGADGMSPNDQVNAIRDVVLAQRERLTRCVERELRPALAEHGIRIISPQRASAGRSSCSTHRVSRSRCASTSSWIASIWSFGLIASAPRASTPASS